MNYILKDIIWEFTSKCNKNCLFCGSKDIIGHKDLSYDEIDVILHEIIAQKDLEFLTITGGEPSIDATLPSIVDIINKEKPDLKVRILTNGLFLTQPKCLKLLDHKNNGIGVSVNTQDDIKSLEDLITNVKDKNKVTMITNFGNHNFNDFLYLFNFSKNFGLWQIQLTIDDKLQLNQDQIKQLLNYIEITDNGNCKILRADNLTGLPCTAGKTSCSITYEGEVIPCLSFRSWRKTLDVQGIIKKEGDLTNIWNNKFEKYRTSKCVCCKDIVGVSELFNEVIPNYTPIKQFDIPKNSNDMSVSVYAVRINDDFSTPTCKKRR